MTLCLSVSHAHSILYILSLLFISLFFACLILFFFAFISEKKFNSIQELLFFIKVFVFELRKLVFFLLDHMHEEYVSFECGYTVARAWTISISTCKGCSQKEQSRVAWDHELRTCRLFHCPPSYFQGLW